MDDDNENLVDLDHISHPGTDPPDDSVPFPDRLQTQIEFWRSIHAPAHIIQALEEGVDIGLIPDIERAGITWNNNLIHFIRLWGYCCRRNYQY